MRDLGIQPESPTIAPPPPGRCVLQREGPKYFLNFYFYITIKIK